MRKLRFAPTSREQELENELYQAKRLNRNLLEELAWAQLDLQRQDQELRAWRRLSSTACLRLAWKQLRRPWDER